MKFTQGQHAAMAPYIEGATPTLIQRLMGTTLGYVLMFGSLGAIACEAFYNGPPWVGNIGIFIYTLMMILCVIGVIVVALARWVASDNEEKEKKLLFTRIKDGTTIRSNFLRSLTLYVPALALFVGGGMWWLTSITMIVWVASQILSVLHLTSAYNLLDEEMKEGA